VPNQGRGLKLDEMQEIARKATRTALGQCRRLTAEENVNLTLGSGIEGDEGIFELYLAGQRPQDAKVISRANVNRYTGEVRVEVFLDRLEE
jgi:hypothetical protein